MRRSSSFDVTKFVSLLVSNPELAKSMATRENVHTIFSFSHGVVSLLCSVGPDDPDLLHYFVGLGASLEMERATLGMGPLHLATEQKKPKLVRALLDLKTPPNIVGVHENALFWAYKNGASGETCGKILIDAGGAKQRPNFEDPVPEWALSFILKREKERANAIAILGLPTTSLKGNGKDVKRIIARCVWATRGHN